MSVNVLMMSVRLRGCVLKRISDYINGVMVRPQFLGKDGVRKRWLIIIYQL